ncbi:MAG: nucleotidyltransferase domain-containing protein [Calditrichae bacterium]|nr:nucleotidyltransferase domain-containing protein [Calditrichota bacterium]MCB9057508.1 nucleotidyltransferase domain-containing protein [Calditrichia bacterium]
MIDLKEDWLEKIKFILNDNVPDYKALAYGSRVNGNAATYSDLDIALIGADKIDWRDIESLKDIFSESDIPIIIDIVDYNAVSENFQKIIQENCAVIKE